MGELRRAVLSRALKAHDGHEASLRESKLGPDNPMELQKYNRSIASQASYIDLKEHRTLYGHDGWIWDVQVDPENDWFATASADNTIKVWSLATGTLKMTLTNHVLPVRCLAISTQMPYMFSGGEDQKLLCWDLEYNRPIRQYHGHRSGVYTVALHPEIPYLLASGSRDSSIRLWDVRTRLPIHVLNHDGPVNKIFMQADEPQLVSGSQDMTIKLWDIRNGACTHTLTHHENSIRALACHPVEYTFVSAARDGIRQWKMPNGELLGDFGTQFRSSDGPLAVTTDASDKVYVGYESGIKIYNYTNGDLLKELPTASPVLCSTIDRSRTRLITGHMDKTVKVWNIR